MKKYRSQGRSRRESLSSGFFIRKISKQKKEMEDLRDVVYNQDSKSASYHYR